jgi:Xaa-Pro aminopeptidase
MVKEAQEVEQIRKAVAITEAGLKATLPRLRVLNHESAVAAELTMHYRKHANAPLAFPPIVGGGVHGATLHYPFNDQPFPATGSVLIDSGAMHAGYCSDVTRTVPLDGRFTGRFKEVYELVLSVNERTIRDVRPGMTLKELNELVWQPIIEAGFEKHHGIGHHMGMDVHDPADKDAKLAPGMVITNEPGIYLPKDGFGIRIEDDLLITKTGCQVLTRNIPKRIDDLEALLTSG